MDAILQEFYGELLLLLIAVASTAGILLRTFSENVSDRQRQRSEAVDILIESYETQKEQIETLHSDKLELVTSNARLVADIDHTMEQYDDVRAERDLLKETLVKSRKDITVLQLELSHAQDLIATLQSENTELAKDREDYEPMRSSLIFSERERLRLEREVIESRENSISLDTVTSQHKSDKAHYLQVINELESKIKSLQSKVNKLKEKPDEYY